MSEFEEKMTCPSAREQFALLLYGELSFDQEERVAGAPQRHLFSRELRGRIKEVLAGLTPRERTVFELRHYQGLRLKRIGEVLGTTEEAAKNCLFRATQKMRAGLGDLV